MIEVVAEETSLVSLVAKQMEKFEGKEMAFCCYEMKATGDAMERPKSLL